MTLKLHDKKYYTDKSFAVIRHKYFENYKEAIHTHDFVELMYVYEGKTAHYINGVEFKLSKGDLLFINYGNSHSFNSTGNMEYINIILKPDFISHSLSGEKNVFSLLTLSDFNEFSSEINHSKKIMHFSKEERKKIEALIMIIEDEQRSDNGNGFVLRSALNVFLAIVFRKMAFALRERMSVDSELLDYIKTNCAENLTAQNVASLCSYNPSYFSRVFKKFAGRSFIEYLTMCRIEKASALLVNSDKSIEEIISDCGFADRTRFFKLFNDKTGVSPLKFRKNPRNFEM